MHLDVRPATAERFDDLALVLGPKKPTSSVCWCLSHRIDARSDGAVRYARECGAPAVEGYPVHNEGAAVDATMAYVGTRGLFEAAGFRWAADTTGVSGGFARVVMQRDLRPA